MNEDEQIVWGQPVSFQDFIQKFQPNQKILNPVFTPFFNKTPMQAAMRQIQSPEARAAYWNATHSQTTNETPIVAQPDGTFRRETRNIPLNTSAEAAKTALEFTPVVGDVLYAGDVADEARQGNYGTAAALAGLAVLPNVVEKPLKKIAKNININFDFSNLQKYIDQAKAEMKKMQERGLTRGEEDVFNYLGSERHIKKIQKDGKTRKEAEAIAKEMKENAMATDYNIGIPISQSSDNFGTVGEYDSGFGNIQKNWLLGNPKYSFKPKYTVREGLDEKDTYRNVLHELGGHGASMGYKPNMYEHQKALQKYEDAMQEWFPHYKEVYNHNSSLKPIRKSEFVNSTDPHLKYLEGVDEYSARARAENIKEGGEDFAELYKYFTKESVDKLKKGIWTIVPIATATASYANQQGLGRKQSANKFYSGGNIIKRFKSKNK